MSLQMQNMPLNLEHFVPRRGSYLEIQVSSCELLGAHNKQHSHINLAP